MYEWANEMNCAVTAWVDEERDISPWLGNVMQREAFDKSYFWPGCERIA